MFRHLPSAQLAEPTEESDEVPLAESLLSTPVVFKSSGLMIIRPPESSGGSSAGSSAGSSEGYVCDSAFESVAAKTKVLLYDEPTARPFDVSGAKAAALVAAPPYAKADGGKAVGAKAAGTKAAGAKAAGAKLDAKAAGTKVGGAKAAGAKLDTKAAGARVAGAKLNAEASKLSADPTSGRLSERERQIIAECWQEVQAKGDKTVAGSASGKASDSALGKDAGSEGGRDHEQEAREAEPGAVKKGAGFGSLFSRSHKGQQGEPHGESHGESGDSHKATFKIPQNFGEMSLMNAKMIGADAAWISMVISSFDTLVASVVNDDDARLLCEVTLLAIRAHKGASRPNLRDFQVCMMTSLRALVPHRWNSEHESAWLHLWAIIEEPSTPVMPLPAKYEKAVETFVTGLSLEVKHEVGLAVFDKMFKEYPKSEMFFKQSNSRLCFIVARAVELSAQLYTEPDACVNELLALGLRHIMYRVPTEFFRPFADFIAEEIEARCDDPLAAEGFRWALDLVSYTMMRAIDEGSSPLLTAIAQNDGKMVRKALGSAGRIDRAQMALHSDKAAAMARGKN